MIKLQVHTPQRHDHHDTEWADQQVCDIVWMSREKSYIISSVTITHNPEYPTPTISIVAPPPGIPLRVYDDEGALLFSTKKGEGVE